MKWRTLSGLIQKVLDVVSAVLFIIMFLMFIVEIFFRYVLNDPISWSIELIMICFLVMLFYTAAVGLPVSRHISFNIVYSALPPRGKQIFSLISNAVGAVVLAISIPGVYNIAVFEHRESTPILHVPFSVFYFSFVLFVVSFTLRLLLGIANLVRPGWRERID